LDETIRTAKWVVFALAVVRWEDFRTREVKTMPDSTIVVIDQGQYRSQRDRELIQSKIRSHAARVSHARRKVLNPRSGSYKHISDRKNSICSTVEEEPVLGPIWQVRTIPQTSLFIRCAGKCVSPACLKVLEYGMLLV
jgi:hypothetical protein